MFLPDALSTVFITNALLISVLTWFLEDPRHRRFLTPIIIANFAGLLLCFCFSSPWLFAAGWLLTILPVFLPDLAAPLAARLALGLSTLALLAGFLLPGLPGLISLLLATSLRKGIFPFHSWVPLALESQRLSTFNLILNSHLGAYLLLRHALPAMAKLQPELLAFFSFLALFTALYASVLALASRQPRRILGLLLISHSAFILSGIETRNETALAGALLVVPLVSLALTMLLMMQQALEDRSPLAALPPHLSGLATHAPRLAVFFFLAALALVGLPGTLAFVAEDLLFNGALTGHPLLGVCLPLATSINAIVALRLAVNHFWGRSAVAAIPISDALPVQRWALSAATLLLFLAGIFPAGLLKLNSGAASLLLNRLAAR